MAGIFKNKTVIIIVGICIAGGIWYGLSSSGSTPPSAITTETVQTTEDKDLVETLLTLRTVTLDGVIFQEPAFVSLHDYGTQIVPEPSGRSNPFAPFDGVLSVNPVVPAVTTATTTKSVGGNIKLPNGKAIKVPAAQGL